MDLFLWSQNLSMQYYYKKIGKKWPCLIFPSDDIFSGDRNQVPPSILLKSLWLWVHIYANAGPKVVAVTMFNAGLSHRTNLRKQYFFFDCSHYALDYPSFSKWWIRLFLAQNSNSAFGTICIALPRLSSAVSKAERSKTGPMPARSFGCSWHGAMNVWKKPFVLFFPHTIKPRASQNQ